MMDRVGRCNTTHTQIELYLSSPYLSNVDKLWEGVGEWGGVNIILDYNKGVVRKKGG